ncbi:MAG: hypothetical protein H7Z17_17060, partial [Fuerstia sp.]|nr:hypothetical protein [Fuerstiella sp.]
RPAVAGAPFELPYTQSLPDNAADRWQLHRDIFVSSLRQLGELRTAVARVQDAAAKARMIALIDALQAGDGAALVSIGRADIQRKSGPRLFFSGEFRTNVNTANNNAAGAIDSANVTVDTQGMSDEQFREWMKSVDPGPNGGIRSLWNYFGDNTFEFQNVAITAVESEEGLLDTVDGLVGTPVQFTGIMVDLNPEDVIDTQIFGRQLVITDADGNKLSGRPDVLHSRWLSFQRNQSVRGSKGAATIFHAAIPHNELEYFAGSKGALGLLRDAAVQTGGLTVEFCTYFTARRLSNADLAAKYQAGEEPENPAFGRIVGCIAPWSSADWSTIPEGRRLNPLPAADGTPAAAIGPAFAEFDAANSSIRVNLINAIAEKDATLDKADIGPLSLQVRTGATVSRVGPLPYDKAMYEQTAGQVRVAVDSSLHESISAGLLEIVRDATGDVIFGENAIVIETDNRSSYVEAGSSFNLQLSARFKGSVTESITRVCLTEYHDLETPVADADKILV